MMGAQGKGTVPRNREHPKAGCFSYREAMSRVVTNREEGRTWKKGRVKSKGFCSHFAMSKVPIPCNRQMTTLWLCPLQDIRKY